MTPKMHVTRLSVCCMCLNFLYWFLKVFFLSLASSQSLFVCQIIPVLLVIFQQHFHKKTVFCVEANSAKDFAYVVDISQWYLTSLAHFCWGSMGLRSVDRLLWLSLLLSSIECHVFRMASLAKIVRVIIHAEEGTFPVWFHDYFKIEILI